MKKLIIVFMGIILFAGVATAQDDADTAWKIKSDVSLMFSQTAFNNWAAGGDNNLTLNGFFNFYAGYIEGKSKWENFLNLAYGQSKVGKQDFRKNEDKIDFLSTYGLQAAEKWYYTASFDFKSQFAEGFDYHDDDPDLGKETISNFLAPAYTSLGLGMEYRPFDYLSFYLSPATARWILVMDQELADKGAFGVDPAEYSQYDTLGMPIPESKTIDGATSRFEFGAKFRMMFVKDIVKNVSLSTKLELFSNYLENPQNVDVNWDTMINMKINDWLSASFGLQMLYDDNTNITDNDGRTGPRTQIKEYLSVGLMYNFAN